MSPRHKPFHPGILGILGLGFTILFFPPQKKIQAREPQPHPPGRPWKVQVVEKKTGRPVPGAEVLVLDPDTLENLEEYSREIQFGGINHLGERIERFGRVYRADRKGIAWIPSFQSVRLRPLVAARKGNLWGVSAIYRVLLPPFRIELSPPKTLQVQVKDAKGRPVAGVQVGLGLRLDRGFSFFPLAAVTKGPRGIARFRHIDPLLQLSKTKKKGIVTLRIPRKKPLSQEVDLWNLPKEPLTFTLPPTGEVLVQVESLEGTLPPGWFFAFLSTKTRKRETSLPPAFQRYPYLPIEDGKALFPFVGLGEKLQVDLIPRPAFLEFLGSRKKGGERTTVRSPGPTRPGERVVIHASTLRPSILTGRILLPSKAPASRRNFWWVLPSQKKSPLSFTNGYFRTDEEGRFRIFVESGKSREKKKVLWLYLLHPRGDLPMEAKAGIPRELSPGEISLGDLRLLPMTLLVSGKVQDPEGAPIPWANLSAWGERPSGPVERFHLYCGRADGKGAFRIYGSREERVEKIGIRSLTPGWVQEKTLTTRARTLGLTLVLRREGRVRAAFLSDPEIPLEGFPVSLVFSEPKKRQSQEWIHENQVLFEGLLPGKAALEVYLPRSSDGRDHYGFEERSKAHLLVKIPDILVESGKSTKDPRLEKIDLRGKIRLLEPDLRDAEGNPIPRGSLLWGENFQNREWFFSREPVFLPAGAPQVIWVGAPGFKPRKIAPRGGKIRVVLEKGIPVELVYAGKAPLPQRPILLGVKLKPQYSRKGNTEAKKEKNIFFYFTPETPQVFKKGRGIRLSLPGPGTYTLSWVLQKEDASPYLSSRIMESKPQVIRVEQSDTLQTFRVCPREKPFLKTLRSFKK